MVKYQAAGEVSSNWKTFYNYILQAEDSSTEFDTYSYSDFQRLVARLFTHLHMHAQSSRLHRHSIPYSHACHAYMCAHRGSYPLFTSSIEEHSAIRKSGTPTCTFLVAVLCSITMPHIIRQQHKWHSMGPAAEIMIHLFLAGHCTSTTWTLYRSIRVAFRFTWSRLYSTPR